MEDVCKQAKQKALSLLADMDRTEEQLRKKLGQKFENEAVEQAIEYVKSFGYVNDLNYAKRYVENRKNTKSRKEIFAALSQKGLQDDLIKQAIELCYTQDDEEQAIRHLVEKKRFVAEESTEYDKKKLYAYLLRKGFRYEEVQKVIQVSCWNA